MRTIAITGSAGGMGRALRQRLEAAGDRVIGVDVANADVIADLSTPAGREAMVAGVSEASGGVLDGLVAAAGISSNGENEAKVVAINYFGAVATLEGLRPLLANGSQPAAVAISSNSTTSQQGIPLDVVSACLAGDEAAACAAAPSYPMCGYPAAKMALAHWVRRQATTLTWLDADIRLNAVAPGVIATPMTEAFLDTYLNLGDLFPVPLARAGTADEVAGLVCYLLGPDARFFCGSFIVMDGGTDAKLRADDWPAPR